MDRTRGFYPPGVGSIPTGRTTPERIEMSTHQTNASKAMSAMALLPQVFDAAQTLERAGLLQGESAADVVKRYVTAHPEINETLATLGHPQQP